MSAGSVQFGWGAPSFADQLPGLPIQDAEAADADNKAIIRLSVRGIITEAERDKAIRRATRRIEQALRRTALSQHPDTTDSEKEG